MPEELSSDDVPFDLQKLKALVRLMEKHDLTEISLRRGEQHWRLRRGARDATQLASPQTAFGAHGQFARDSQPTPPAIDDNDRRSGTVDITSPTVGTFYAAPSPEEPPFVQVGSKVAADTVVCIVEAMKVFNQIPAEVNGTIVEVLINSGDPVEFGQPLFRVRPG
jgi:acetyl-CoA carboxylase biotin carboxyl carrier protein